MSFLDTLADDIATNPNAGLDVSDKIIKAGTYTWLINKCESEQYVFGSWKEADAVAAMAADPNLIPGKQISLEFEIVEGDLAGKKFWDRLVYEPSSNHPTFPTKNGKKFTPQDLCGMNADALKAIFKRAGATVDDIKSRGLSFLLNRTVTIPIVVEPDKKGIPRNKMKYLITKGETPEAPKKDVQTSRPRVDDSEDPF